MAGMDPRCGGDSLGGTIHHVSAGVKLCVFFLSMLFPKHCRCIPHLSIHATFLNFIIDPLLSSPENGECLDNGSFIWFIGSAPWFGRHPRNRLTRLDIWLGLLKPRRFESLRFYVTTVKGQRNFQMWHASKGFGEQRSLCPPLYKPTSAAVALWFLTLQPPRQPASPDPFPPCHLRRRARSSSLSTPTTASPPPSGRPSPSQPRGAGPALSTPSPTTSSTPNMISIDPTWAARVRIRMSLRKNKMHPLVHSATPAFLPHNVRASVLSVTAASGRRHPSSIIRYVGAIFSPLTPELRC